MAPTGSEIPNGDRPASELTKREWFAGMIAQRAVSEKTFLANKDVKEVVELADHLLDALENTKEPA